jgi:HTH DNA binding domain
MESGAEDDDLDLWRPPWETDTVDEPPGTVRRRRPPAEPDDRHPLLAPLARAQDAVARLEARIEAASPAVAEGLRARMSYREASGWLSHSHVWVHPQDLALRDAGLTGSYGTAARAGRLEPQLPATMVQGSQLDALPSDVSVDLALRFARNWRRLAEHRTWKPIADTDALRETLQSLGFGGAFRLAEAEDWLASVYGRDEDPALIRAGRAARDWMNRSQSAVPLGLDAMFLGVCCWRDKGFGRSISLPFWAAGEQRHHRLSLRVGMDWMASFLDCATAAARHASDELTRLQAAEEKARSLSGTVRSRLPNALQTVLRAPIVTARGLAESLDVTPQASLGLLRQLMNAGIIREATGRASWRAFILA